jgi:predicted XRE-type DNA-binding protein
MQDDNEAIEFEIGSGNVFADLGLPNPVERLAKAQLMRAINNEIDRLGITQAMAARRVDLSQPDISNIARGRGSAFSIDRLMNVLSKLDIEVEINLRRGNGGLVVRERAS